MRDDHGVYSWQRENWPHFDERSQCNNCKTYNWGAKNDDYCNRCEKEYIEIFYRVFSREHNPLQDYADAILLEVQGHA